MAFQSGAFQFGAFQQAGVVVQPPAKTPGGASGKHYNYSNLDLDLWRKKKLPSKATVEKRIDRLEAQIQRKRNLTNAILATDKAVALMAQIQALIQELGKQRSLLDEIEKEEAMLAAVFIEFFQ